MLCNKCGNPLEENAVCCSKCGEIFDTSKTFDDADLTDTTDTQDQSQTSNEDSSDFATADFDKPQKKSKKKKIILSVVSLLLVVVIVFVSLNFSYILGHFIRIFLGDATYLKYVELLNIKKVSACATNLYTTSAKVLSDDFEKTVQTDIISLEDLFSGLGSLNLFGNNEDSNSSDESTPDSKIPDIDSDANSNNGFNLDFLPGNDTTTLSANTSSQPVMVSASSDSAAVDKKTDEDSKKKDDSIKENINSFFVNEYTKIFESDAVQDALPSKKQLKKLAEKYATIICNEITNEHVNAYYKDVTINSITQKLYVIEFTLDQSTYNTICKNLIEELKNDKVIKEVIDGLSQALFDQGYIKKTDVLYSKFTDILNNRLEEVNKSIKAKDNDVMFTLVDYVNNQHEIVGRDIIKDNKVTFSYLTVTNKDKFENKVTSLKDSKTTSLIGSGTQKGNIINTEWTLSKDNKTLMYITLNDFNKKQAFNGSPNGEIKITPTGTIIKSIVNFPGVELLSPQINIDFSLSKDGALLDAKVSVFSKDIVSISYKATKVEK